MDDNGNDTVTACPVITYPVQNFINPPILDPNSIRKFITKLPNSIILKPKSCEKVCINNIEQKVPFYEVTMLQRTFQFHPDIPPTTVWTYNGEQFPIQINVERGEAIQVKWINLLPFKHLLEVYIDHTLAGASKFVPDVRNVVHLHGGEDEATSDGGPLDWFTPTQYTVDTYPNQQQPTMLFFHDHAMGITRLNAYAGLTSGVYIINEREIERKLNLPKGKYEIPLVLIDRTFSTDGSLVYSTSNSGPAHPKWNSAFLGKVITVNNAVWPFLKVKRTKYRFRIVNASDTRTYSLIVTGLNNPTKSAVAFYQIGTDGGYLAKPVVLNDPANPGSPQLLLSIGERADIIINFKKFAPGTELIMRNTANAPFPNGQPPDPNTVGQVMKFIVVPSKFKKHFSIRTPHTFKPLDPNKISVIRQLVLQVDGQGSTNPQALYINNFGFMVEDCTERPILGSTELWEYVNVTKGLHPMHIHLVETQILNRQNFDAAGYIKALQEANKDSCPGEGIRHPIDVNPFLQGNPIPPAANEAGWKDVVQANGQQVTRVIVRFAPQQDGTVFPFDATKYQYTFHCHIVSHEDNEMMRPFRLFNQLTSI